MGKVFWSRRSRSDLVDILLYIRRDNHSAARRFYLQLTLMLQHLADHPMMGASRPELGRDLRSLPHGNYLVFYRPRKDGIELARVLHGARDLRRIFKPKQ
jgi:toxin ParE1/3/4